MARIVHLANFVGPRSGGLRTTLLHLASGYHEAGHDVHLVIPAFPEPWPYRTPARIHALPSTAIPRSGGYRVVRSGRLVRAILDDLQPDVIELSDRLTLISAAHWGRAHAVPVTFFAHERLDGVIQHHLQPLPPRLIADRLNSRLAAVASAIVTTTRFAAMEFTRIGVPTRHIPLGVNARDFTPRLEREDGRDGIRLVMCSRLSREKSPGTAISLLREARAQGRPWSLMVVGDGPLRRVLEEQARGLPVTFTGHVRDRSALAALLREADACLAPGPIETFGLAALEALACGTPVVCHQDSAIPEVVQEAGIAVAGGPRDWVRAVDEVVGPQAGGLRHAARARALQLPWSAVVERLLAHHGLAEARPAACPTSPSRQRGAPDLRAAA